MNYSKVIKHIVNWLNSYTNDSKTKGYVVGISGGIDSAVTSTLAAYTGHPTLCLEMPIYQSNQELERSGNHIEWLKNNFSNVSSEVIDLTESFDKFSQKVQKIESKNNLLALANSRSRLRMTTLYYYAAINNYLVVGTGNKVEDFGVGFYTKYGDGGVDLSPIADLMKTDVRLIAKELGIIDRIIKAPPTDGLWDDSRTDEDQLGASYEELEKAMKQVENKVQIETLSSREIEVYKILNQFNYANKHKMEPIPICIIPEHFKTK
ncbi:MAG: NAD(+) synthase [Cryomorphaceae bacterium MED-G14]|nr:MAG: NAD(+) synthase [Cryomorphaceae bacterium MED-G14]|tara:strand:+ start:17 stop:808 length:792 start_codon:yes stop_codon:yes gene_type:complete